MDFSDFQEEDAGRRAKRIAQGAEVLGFKRVNAEALQVGQVCSFIYQAKQPGLKGTQLFDSNPTIVFLGVKRSQDGKLYAIGFNANYLTRFVDKSAVILRLKTGTRLPSRFLEEAVHAYRLERIVSSVYKAIDVNVDPVLLSSKALWRYVTSFT